MLALRLFLDLCFDPLEKEATRYLTSQFSPPTMTQKKKKKNPCLYPPFTCFLLISEKAVVFSYPSSSTPFLLKPFPYHVALS